MLVLFADTCSSAWRYSPSISLPVVIAKHSPVALNTNRILLNGCLTQRDFFQLSVEAPISRRLIFSSPQRFFDKAKIEHLARRHFFRHCQTFLGEIDRAAHPGVIQVTEPAEAA